MLPSDSSSLLCRWRSVTKQECSREVFAERGVNTLLASPRSFERRVDAVPEVLAFAERPRDRAVLLGDKSGAPRGTHIMTAWQAVHVYECTHACWRAQSALRGRGHWAKRSSTVCRALRAGIGPYARHNSRQHTHLNVPPVFVSFARGALQRACRCVLH